MADAARGGERGHCSSVQKGRPAPDGWTLEAQLTHPKYGPLLRQRIPCELDDGHEGPHRNGGLIWHDPPLLMIGGRPYEPSDEPWLLFGEVVDPRTD